MSIDFRVTDLPIEDIVPFEGNPRTHSKKQIQLLADCIGAYKIIAPLIVDQNKILVAGETRLSAAKLLGIKVVPTICVSHLSEAEKRAYVIADNRIAELADWSPDGLKTELEFLSRKSYFLVIYIPWGKIFH
jgi:ParB-like chromosome segregation protein Spo0J